MKNATIPSRSFKFGRLRPSFWRTLLLVLALPLADGSAANAAPFQNGEFITYDQNPWSGTNPGGQLLVADYNTVYASTFNVVTVGLPSTGFTMAFDGASKVLNYLPASGTPAPLNGNTLDPSSTASGVFGGDVLGAPIRRRFLQRGVPAAPFRNSFRQPRSAKLQYPSGPQRSDG